MTNLSCVNHSEKRPAGKCSKCRLAFCDPCLAFSVNGAPWCEPCGNALADDVKPRWVLGGLVLGGGVALTTVVWLAKITFIPVRVPYFTFLMFLAYSGSMFAAWRVTSTTTGTPPEILRR